MIEGFNDWLKNFKAGKKEAVNLLYEEFRPSFVHWMVQKYDCTEEDAIDVFQDTIIVVYKNAQAGKLDKLKSSLKTYIFGVGKNVLSTKLRRHKAKTFESPLAFMESPEMGAEEKMELMERKKMIANMLKKMQIPCQRILHLFFYRRYSVEAIQKTLNYKSREVVRTQKKRCIKGLQKRMKQELNQKNL